MNNREAFEKIILETSFAKTANYDIFSVKECGSFFYFPVNLAYEVFCAVLASQQQDHIVDSNKLVQAVNALAAQTGESPESITEWLCDKGGLTQLMLSHFGGMQSQTQQTESKLVAWGYAWQCKSVGDWRIEKLGEGCIPPKDTLALYTAPEGESK